MVKAYLCARSEKPEPEIFMCLLPPARAVGISIGSFGIVLHCQSVLHLFVKLAV